MCNFLPSQCSCPIACLKALVWLAVLFSPCLVASQTNIQDGDNDTTVETDRGGIDNDRIIFKTAGTDRLQLTAGRIEPLNTGNSIFLGSGAGRDDNLTLNNNIFIGTLAGQRNVDGQLNTAIGVSALRLNINNSNNTAIGPSALLMLTSGSNNNANTAIGPRALDALTAGNSNLAIGTDAAGSLISGSGNLILGHASGSNKTGGDFNTLLGAGAGANNGSGTNNVFIGYLAGANESGSNKLYISNSATSTPLIKGDFANGTLDLTANTTVLGDLTVTGSIQGSNSGLDVGDQLVVVSNRVIGVDSGVVHAVYDPSVGMPNHASALFGDARVGGNHGTGATLLADYKGLQVNVANDYCGLHRPSGSSSSTCPDTTWGIRVHNVYAGTGHATGAEIYAEGQNSTMGLDIRTVGQNANVGQRIQVDRIGGGTNPLPARGAEIIVNATPDAEGVYVTGSGTNDFKGVSIEGTSQSTYTGLKVSGQSSANATGIDASVAGGIGISYGGRMISSSAGAAIGIQVQANSGGTSTNSATGAEISAGGDNATGLIVSATTGLSLFGGISTAQAGTITSSGQYATGLLVDVESLSAPGANYGIASRVVGRDSTFGGNFDALSDNTHAVGVRGRARDLSLNVPTVTGVEGIASGFKLARGVDACSFSQDSLSIAVDARAKRTSPPHRSGSEGSSLLNSTSPLGLGLGENSSIGVRASAYTINSGNEAFAFYADSTYALGTSDEAWGLFSPYNQNYLEMVRVGGFQRTVIDSIALNVGGLTQMHGYISQSVADQGRGVLTVNSIGPGAAVIGSASDEFFQGLSGYGGIFSGATGVASSGYIAGDFSAQAGGFYDPPNAVGVASRAHTFSATGVSYAFKADTSSGSQAYAFHADNNTSFFRSAKLGATSSPKFYSNLPDRDSLTLSVIGRSAIYDTTDVAGLAEGALHIQLDGDSDDAALVALASFTANGGNASKSYGIVAGGGAVGITAIAGSPNLAADSRSRTGGEFIAYGTSDQVTSGVNGTVYSTGSGSSWAMHGNAAAYSAQAGLCTGAYTIGTDIGVSAWGDNTFSTRIQPTYGLRTRATTVANARAYGLYVRESEAPTDDLEYAISAPFNKSYIHRLAIGSDLFATGYALSVDGDVIAEQFTTMPSTSWPDYVFADKYELMSLTEVENYVQRYRHLPGMPSESTIAEEGQHLNLIQTILVEKVEELTLHLIAEQKARVAAETSLAETQAVLTSLLDRVESLEEVSTKISNESDE